MKNIINFLVILVIILSFSFLGCSQTETPEINVVENDKMDNIPSSSSDDTEANTTNNINENTLKDQDTNGQSFENLNFYNGIRYFISNDCIQTMTEEIEWKVDTNSDAFISLDRIVIFGNDTYLRDEIDSTDETVAYNIYYARHLIDNNIDYARARLYAIQFLRENIFKNGYMYLT